MVIMQELRSSHAVKQLLVQTTQEGLAQGLLPTDFAALHLNYGIVLGILMERERASRRKVI
jgi:hypothetical protein